MRNILQAAAAIAAGVLWTTWAGQRAVRLDSFPPTDVWTNEQFVSGLYSELDLEDPHAVFSHIFHRLPKRVVVYPSEGYYYFRFPCRGVTVKGTMLLAVNTRDQGILEFGYSGEIEESPNYEQHTEVAGRHHDFSSADGFELVRKSAFEYRAEYEGTTVHFELFDPGCAPPDHLAEGEIYVGTTVDESGTSFDLLYREDLERFLWVLDESGFVPEALTELGDHFLLGARTRFVYAVDRARARKILVGVSQREVEYNTWYDGPFDQLPDTHIALGNIEFKKYLLQHTGYPEDSVDQHGILVHTPGARVPVGSYRHYQDLTEFQDLLPTGPPPPTTAAWLEAVTVPHLGS